MPWRLGDGSLYNDEHFFVPNEIGHYSVGTKNTALQCARDGLLTISVQVDAPTDPHQRTNWLPAPKVGPIAATFPSPKHLASWMGAYPGNEESAA